MKDLVLRFFCSAHISNSNHITAIQLSILIYDKTFACTDLKLYPKFLIEENCPKLQYINKSLFANKIEVLLSQIVGVFIQKLYQQATR